ncbi:MAG: YHYH protein [Acidimicrobiia bacterium]
MKLRLQWTPVAVLCCVVVLIGGGLMACSPAKSTVSRPASTSKGCGPAANFPDLANAAGAGAGYAKPSVQVSCTENELVVESNGMISYPFVPMTPNPLRAQDFTWKVPRQPALAAMSTSIVNRLGTLGFSVTGLPIYGPTEGAMPASEAFGDPNYNGILDTCKGHTGPGSEYHLHAVEQSNACGFTASPIVGYALDGFPIYGPNGCLDLSCQQVVTFQSGYERTGDPKTNVSKAYSYRASSDVKVLDECNGRIGPDGTYRYYATATFPYTFGCFRGTPTAQSGGAAAPMPPMGPPGNRGPTPAPGR